MVDEERMRPDHWLGSMLSVPCLDNDGWVTERTSPHTTTVSWPFFWDHPGEPVPEENFWTLWCKGRLREADTHLAGHHSIRTNQCQPLPSCHPPIFLQTGCPSCRPTNSVKALKDIRCVKIRFHNPKRFCCVADGGGGVELMG